ncbi:amino acid adenylation domain-containing protein [Vibrio cholerae]|nr:amino acid adenylation domain-containing protein [Vibrio cholerae]
MKLIDREFWLNNREAIEACLCSLDKFKNENQSGKQEVSLELPQVLVLKKDKLLKGNERLTWSLIASAVSLLLYRAGGGSKIALNYPAAPTLSLPVIISVDPKLSFKESLIQSKAQCDQVLGHSTIKSTLIDKWFGDYLKVTINHQTTHNGISINLIGSTLSLSSDSAPKYLLDFLLKGIESILHHGLSDYGVMLQAIPNALDTKSYFLTGFEQNQSSSFVSISEQIYQQFLKYPEGTAIQCSNYKLTYRKLIVASYALANTIRTLGISKEDIVALSYERNSYYVLLAVSIFVAGGAYLPIERTMPLGRKQQLAKHAHAYITDDVNSCGPSLRVHCVHQLLEQALEASFMPSKEEYLLWQPESNDLAYVIYTSGSTGEPKGVCIEHHSFMRLLKFREQNCELGNGKYLPQTAGVSFDISVWQMFASLTCGGATMVVSDEVVQTPALLIDAILSYRFEYIEIVPTLIALLLDQCDVLASLKTKLNAQLKAVISTGEVLNQKLANRFLALLPDVHLLNAYGPAECTDDVTQGIVSASSRLGPCSVGEPLAYCNIYILDEDRQLLPAEILGEIYIGGENVGRGYLAQPQLTAESFIQDPYVDGDARMYKTGDLGYYTSQKELYCVGRSDSQIKFRGRRIELGEIETQIRYVEQVKDCVALLIEDDFVQKIVAFVKANDMAAEVHEAIQARLVAVLPAHLIPSKLIVVDQFPTNVNGKVDRKKLIAFMHEDESKKSLCAPQTQVEELIHDLWCQFLNLNAIDIHDNFFELGGDSILSIRIAHEAKQRGLNLSPRIMIEHPSIRGVAQYLDKQQCSKEHQEISYTLPKRAPLTAIQGWFFQQSFDDSHHWNQSYVLQSKDALNEEALKNAIAALVNHHTQLRVCFPMVNSRRVQQLASVCDELLWHRKALPKEQAANEIHQSLNLNEGPLIRFGLLDDNILLISAHHLVVDQVSWHILLEDLETLYLAECEHQKVTLATSMPFLCFATENAYEPVETIAEPQVHAATLCAIDNSIANRYGDHAIIEISFTIKETSDLLSGFDKSSNTIPALLLAGLSNYLAQTCHQLYLPIEIENHGRFSQNDLDIDRTIGWFTELHRLSLPLTERASVSETMSYLDELIHDKSLYGASVGRASCRPQIAFNYLGMQDSQVTGSGFFNILPDLGQRRSPDSHRPLEWEVNAAIVDGQLTVMLEYVPLRHDKPSLMRLMDGWKQAIIDVKSSDSNSVLLAPVAPAQAKFFSWQVNKPSHWNHAIRFTLSKVRTEHELRDILDRLVSNNPALSARFIARSNRMWMTPSDTACSLKQVTLSADLTDAEANDQVQSYLNEEHGKLNIETGHLARALYVVNEQGTMNDLTLIVHHLAVDPFAWSVIADDLEQLLTDKTAYLPTRNTNYWQWTKKLNRLVHQQPNLLGYAYWSNFAHKYNATSLVDEHVSGALRNKVSSDSLVSEQYFSQSDFSQTTDSNQLIGSLLACLAMAMSKSLNIDRAEVLVELGGHGRTDLLDDSVIVDCVGWFTYSYPFAVPLDKRKSFSQLRDLICERLATVPNQGFGFDALRYMSRDHEVMKTMAGISIPQIQFEYEGKLSFLNTRDESKSIAALSADDTGQWKDASSQVNCPLELNLSIIDDQLHIRSQFMGELEDAWPVTALIHEYLNTIKTIAWNKGK